MKAVRHLRHWLGSKGPVLLGAVALAAVAGAVVLAAPALRDSGAAPVSAAPAGPVPTGAAPADADPLFVAFEGDPQAGQRVVMGAGGAGVQGNCFQCHGLQGQGDQGGAFPRLAGQPAWYLYKQLNDYANGTRPNDIMTPIALRLSSEERRDVAAYFAAASAAHGSSETGAGRLAGGVDAEQVQRGGAIAAVGSPQRGVQSCVGCHGPAGSGLPPDTPYLAGLSPQYMELQLRLWAEGKRTNDPLGVMADVARRLTPEERSAVAQYFGSLPPPGP